MRILMTALWLQIILLILTPISIQAQNAWQDGGITLWTQPEISHEHLAVSIGDDRLAYAFQPTNVEPAQVAVRIIDGEGEFVLEDSLVVSNPEIGCWLYSISRSTNGDGLILYLEGRGFDNNTYMIQRFNSEGETVWDDHGISFRAVGRPSQNGEIISDDQNGCFVVLSMDDENNRLVFRFNEDGQLREGWDEDGIEVTVGESGHFMADGAGGVWFHNNRLYNRLQDDGTLRWDEMQSYIDEDDANVYAVAFTAAPDAGLYLAYYNLDQRRLGLALIDTDGETVVSSTLGQGFDWQGQRAYSNEMVTDDVGRLYFALGSEERDIGHSGRIILFDPTLDDPLPWGENGVRLSIEAHLDHIEGLRIVSGSDGVFISAFYSLGHYPDGVFVFASFIGGIDHDQNEWGDEIHTGRWVDSMPTTFQNNDGSVWITTDYVGATRAFRYSAGGDEISSVELFHPIDRIKSFESHTTADGRYTSLWSQRHRGFCVQELNEIGELQFEEEGMPVQHLNSNTYIEIDSRIVNDHLFVISDHYDRRYPDVQVLSIFDPENNLTSARDIYDILTGPYDSADIRPYTHLNAVIIYDAAYRIDGNTFIITAIDSVGNIIWQNEFDPPFEGSYYAEPKYLPEVGWIIRGQYENQIALFNIDDDGELVWDEPLIFEYDGSIHDITYRDGTLSMIGISSVELEGEEYWKVDQIDIEDGEASDPLEIFPFRERKTGRATWSVQTAHNGNIWFHMNLRDSNQSLIAALNSENERLIGDSGLRISHDGRRDQPNLIVDPDGGCWVVWERINIKAIHIDPQGGRYEGRWHQDGEVIFDDEELELVDTALDEETNTLYITAKNDNSYFVQLIGEEWLSVKDPDVLLPTETTLFPPAPNPFNSTSLIKFALSRSGNARLSLYDISGRRVRDIIDSEMHAGSYEITFEAESLSAGSYFLRLVTRESSITQKMILLK